MLKAILNPQRSSFTRSVWTLIAVGFSNSACAVHVPPSNNPSIGFRTPDASVFQVLCKNGSGTAFAHKSGKLITAAHVISECEATDLIVFGTNATRIPISSIIKDDDRDLALMTPRDRVDVVALQVAAGAEPLVGSEVCTWGYPFGYRGNDPLLSFGHVAGSGPVKIEGQPERVRLVINGAINGGNSGGPLLDVRSGAVVGVIVSKLNPLPEDLRSELAALREQRSGMVYSFRARDGSDVQLSEAQVVEDVLNFLRSQVQMVVGHAVTLRDLSEFLNAHGVEP